MLLSFLLPSGLEVEGRQDWDNLWCLVDTGHEKNTPVGEDLFSIVGRNTFVENMVCVCVCIYIYIFFFSNWTPGRRPVGVSYSVFKIWHPQILTVLVRMRTGPSQIACGDVNPLQTTFWQFGE